jgi:predicted esterase YcpF (UPF0227 family)
LQSRPHVHSKLKQGNEHVDWVTNPVQRRGKIEVSEMELKSHPNNFLIIRRNLLMSKKDQFLSQKARHQDWLGSITKNAAANKREAKQARSKAELDTRTVEDIKRAKEEQERQYMNWLKEQDEVYGRQRAAKKLQMGKERLRSRKEAVSILLQGVDVSQLADGHSFFQEIMDQIEVNSYQLDRSQLFLTTFEAHRTQFRDLLMGEIGRLYEEGTVVNNAVILEQALSNVVEQVLEQKSELDAIEIKSAAQNSAQISSGGQMSAISQEIKEEKKPSEVSKSSSSPRMKKNNESFTKEKDQFLSQKAHHQDWLGSIAKNAAANKRETEQARSKAELDTRTVEDIKRAKEEQERQYMNWLKEQDEVYDRQLLQERLRSRKEAVSILLQGVDVSQLADGHSFSQEIMDQIKDNRSQLNRSQLFFTTHEAHRTQFRDLLMGEIGRLYEEGTVVNNAVISEQTLSNVVEQVLEQQPEKEHGLELDEIEIKEGDGIEMKSAAEFAPVSIISQLSEEIEEGKGSSEEGAFKSPSPLQGVNLKEMVSNKPQQRR